MLMSSVMPGPARCGAGQVTDPQGQFHVAQSVLNRVVDGLVRFADPVLDGAVTASAGLLTSAPVSRQPWAEGSSQD
jgi:hypothetical protein